MPIASPATQVYYGHPVGERGVEQANRGVDQAVDSEEAHGDNEIGL